MANMVKGGKKPWKTTNICIEFYEPQIGKNGKVKRNRFKTTVLQNAKGRIQPFNIDVYEYEAKLLDVSDIPAIYNAIVTFINTGTYTDPLAGTNKRSKHISKTAKIVNKNNNQTPSTQSQVNQVVSPQTQPTTTGSTSGNLNCSTIHLDASDLKYIITEAARRILTESPDSVESTGQYYTHHGSYPFVVFKGFPHNKTDKNESRNMTQKNTIRLTESELKNIINDSIKNIISELDYKTYINAYKKAEKNGDARAKKFFDAASDEFNKQYGFDDEEGIFYMDDFEHSDGEHSATWWHFPNGNRQYSPDNVHDFDKLSRPAKLRQKRKDLPQRVKQGEREYANYIKGNYEYTKDKGWDFKR